ncbi:hypothetical protein NP233_g16 [Leucocoprinus birnbaumii]|uniref:Septin-type G domain-containing protein n=1 Tax=Leucocoprinus birnbaumii TaxID=56174 RepID=A0AAD5W613_9AGAR|nr:hypothetical protein NP233_g16 [Leucocoprinus birnbaumii]
MKLTSLAVLGLYLLVPALATIPEPVDRTTAGYYLGNLTVAPKNSVVSFGRESFHTWTIAYDNCDTRNVVLKRDGNAVVADEHCIVKHGNWYSPYDAASTYTASSLDISHIVPLEEAWASGASLWNATQREAFANDLTRPHLVVATHEVNVDRGAQTPTSWMPPALQFRCIYTRAWIHVKFYYNLTVEQTEKDMLQMYLGNFVPSHTSSSMASVAPINDGIGIANLPNQRHKIVAKRGAHFTIMVVGESGLGKTTLINTLFSTELSPPKNYNRRHHKQLDKLTEVEIIKAELEEKQFKVKLTVIDTPGFGDYVNNSDSWTPIVEFIDDQHEAYMRQEQQPQRSEKTDLRVHACLYFIRPTGHTLKPLDIEIMKRLGTRVNLIPVVAKADTLTQNDLHTFKQRIREVVTAQGIRIYTPPIEADDESADLARALIEAMPFSIIGSTEDVKTADGRVVKGREYLWGVAEVENENHCDFKKLRSLLIRTHMLDLVSTTEETHYENYRQQQMETRKFGEPKVKKTDNPKFKEEEEGLRKKFTEQVKAEEARFRKWEQHLIAERDRLNKDLEEAHSAIKQLEAELDGLNYSRGTNRR